MRGEKMTKTRIAIILRNSVYVSSNGYMRTN